jgi:hypothetical protein
MLGVTEGGTGKHKSALTIPQAIYSLRAWYICEAMYVPITLAIRTSICIFLLRIAAGRIYKWVIYINLAAIWAISIAFFIVLVAQCNPPSYFWEQLLGKPGHCISPNIVPDMTVAHSAISALSDFTIALLPAVLLRNVQINLRTKVTIALLLSMGIL